MTELNTIQYITTKDFLNKTVMVKKYNEDKSQYLENESTIGDLFEKVQTVDYCMDIMDLVKWNLPMSVFNSHISDDSKELVKGAGDKYWEGKTKLVRNDILTLDIDHIPSDKIQNIRRLMLNNDYIGAIWSSYGGVGLKALVPFTHTRKISGANEYSDAMKSMVEYFEDVLSIEIDKSHTNISILGGSYMSYQSYGSLQIREDKIRLFDLDSILETNKFKSMRDNHYKTKVGKLQKVHTGTTTRKSLDVIRDSWRTRQDSLGNYSVYGFGREAMRAGYELNDIEPYVNAWHSESLGLKVDNPSKFAKCPIWSITEKMDAISKCEQGIISHKMTSVKDISNAARRLPFKRKIVDNSGIHCLDLGKTTDKYISDYKEVKPFMKNFLRSSTTKTLFLNSGCNSGKSKFISELELPKNTTLIISVPFTILAAKEDEVKNDNIKVTTYDKTINEIEGARSGGKDVVVAFDEGHILNKADHYRNCIKNTINYVSNIYGIKIIVISATLSAEKIPFKVTHKITLEKIYNKKNVKMVFDNLTKKMRLDKIIRENNPNDVADGDLVIIKANNKSLLKKAYDDMDAILKEKTLVISSETARKDLAISAILETGILPKGIKLLLVTSIFVEAHSILNEYNTNTIYDTDDDYNSDTVAQLSSRCRKAKTVNYNVYCKPVFETLDMERDFDKLVQVGYSSSMNEGEDAIKKIELCLAINKARHDGYNMNHLRAIHNEKYDSLSQLSNINYFLDMLLTHNFDIDILDNRDEYNKEELTELKETADNDMSEIKEQEAELRLESIQYVANMDDVAMINLDRDTKEGFDNYDMYYKKNPDILKHIYNIKKISVYKGFNEEHVKEMMLNDEVSYNRLVNIKNTSVLLKDNKVLITRVNDKLLKLVKCKYNAKGDKLLRKYIIGSELDELIIGLLNESAKHNGIDPIGDRHSFKHNYGAVMYNAKGELNRHFRVKYLDILNCNYKKKNIKVDGVQFNAYDLEFDADTGEIIPFTNIDFSTVVDLENDGVIDNETMDAHIEHLDQLTSGRNKSLRNDSGYSCVAW